MTTTTLLPRTTTAVANAIRGIDRLDPTAPTPCEQFDAVALINHFVGTVGALARIGRGEPLDPENPWGQGGDAAAGPWRTRLADGLDQLGAAWADERAWAGSIDFGSGEMTAAQTGRMAFGEALLHGWDLTRAAGTTLTVPDDVGAALYEFVAETGELGRSMGAYGPAVPVAEDRTAFHRALGLAGRDPDWTPDGPGPA